MAWARAVARTGQAGLSPPLAPPASRTRAFARAPARGRARCCPPRNQFTSRLARLSETHDAAGTIGRSPSIRHRRLGQTGLNISEFTLGGGIVGGILIHPPDE